MVLMQDKELLCDKLMHLFNLGRKVERYPDIIQKIRDYKIENNSYRYSYFGHTHIGYILNATKFQQPSKPVYNTLDPKPVAYLGYDSSITELPEFIHSIEVTIGNNPYAFFLTYECTVDERFESIDMETSFRDSQEFIPMIDKINDGCGPELFLISDLSDP